MVSGRHGVTRIVFLACAALTCLLAVGVFLVRDRVPDRAGPPSARDVAPAQAPAVRATRGGTTPLEASLHGSMDEFLSVAEKGRVLAWIVTGAPEAGYAEVRPILDAHCVGCHNTDAMPAFALDTFASVARFARPEGETPPRTVLEASLEDSMAEFIDAPDKHALVQWIQAGASAAGFAAVQPIFEEQCVVCHNQEDMPEMPLRTFAEVGPFVSGAGTGADAHAAGSPLHPAVRLLDAAGRSVVQSGAPVSTIATCGQCHDTDYIAGHSYHVSVGLEAYAEPGTVPRGRPWDTSPGLFGRWDPLTYRVLTPPGGRRLDVGTADWVRVFGVRHVGGGPAAISREGRPLTELPVTVTPDPETYVLDDQSGQAEPWDWRESGIVEMNCFLCHIRVPDNAARLGELAAGRFRWAATATLAGTGLVTRTASGWEWSATAFTKTGAVPRALLGLGAPRSANCGLCHGAVEEHPDPTVVRRALDQWRSATTGQLFSAERLAESGVDVDIRNGVSRPWDVHALRLLECVNCHYSLNNPAYRESRAMPAHLRFDARRPAIGEYLKQPSHQFATGRYARGAAGGNAAGSMRRCESCHRVEATHTWLPYRQRHLNAMTCEACHVPKLYAAARRQTDWTLLNLRGEPRVESRRVFGDGASDTPTLTGYTPVLLPRTQSDGAVRLTPHNLITSWYWIAGDPPAPVRFQDLRAALFGSETYHPDVLTALDGDGNGMVDSGELALDTPAKVEAIRRRLAAVGVADARIQGEIQPFSLHHNVAPGPWATRECGTCHSADSRVTQPFLLASYVPGDVLPILVSDANARLAGRLRRLESGALQYEPDAAAADLYIIGQSRWAFGDRLGVWAVCSAALGVFIHAALRVGLGRVRFRRRRAPPRKVPL